jgi:hypothetical protein
MLNTLPDLPVNRQAWNVKTRRPWKRADISDAQVICAANDAQRPGVELEPFQLLMVIVGCPFKVAVSAMLRAHRRGLIAGGIAKDSCRITPAGVAHVETRAMLGLI